MILNPQNPTKTGKKNNLTKLFEYSIDKNLQK